MGWSIYVSDVGEPARLLMKTMTQERAAGLVARIEAIGSRMGRNELRVSVVPDTEPQPVNQQPVY